MGANFTVQVSTQGANGRFAKAEDRIRAAITRGLTKWGIIAVARAKELIQKGPKTGIVYDGEISFTTRSGDKVEFTSSRPRHQASAPGEPPASDTGRLAGSIRYEILQSGTVLRVTAGTDYAAYLEFGTRNMAARPFLLRALRETSEQGLAFVREELRKAA